jgi:hypothetical protein
MSYNNLTEKRSTTTQDTHSWTVYHLNGPPAELIGIVHHQPDAGAAIEHAIIEYDTPPNEQGRPMAQWPILMPAEA